jgi:hypothetical protein
MGWLRRRRRPEESVDATFLDSSFLVLADVRLASDDDDDDETPFLPAFTSKEILHRFEPDASDPIPLRGSNVLLLLLETDCAGVVIDPGEPDCSTISRSAAEELVGASNEALWAGPKILLASPDEPPPPTLLDAFRTACERDPMVTAAYLVLAAAPGGEAFPRTVLGIQLSSGDELSDELIASINGLRLIPKADVAATPTTYMNMDIQVFSGDLLDTVRELGILVYQR